MNRMARLEHDPMAGISPVPMASNVPIPFHVLTGTARHPTHEPPVASETLPINVDWPRVIAAIRMGDTDIGRLVGRDRTTVREWREGRAAPTGEAKRELVRLFRQRGGGELPGQMSSGSTGAAIPSIAPRKRGRPSKADVAARKAAITAAELLGTVERPAPAATRVIDHMTASDKPQPAKPAPKVEKPVKPTKLAKTDGRLRPRPTPAVMAAQGRVLAEARKALGLTQAGAALRAHIAAPTFGNYETGTTPIPPARYDTLAAALKLPADWHQVTA